MSNTNIELQTIPKRSYLYNLKPIELGTAYVESMTSYLTRLADAYSVPPFKLIKYILIPAQDAKRQPNKPLYSMFNTIGIWSTRFVAILEQFTVQDKLKFMTMLPYSNILTQYKLCEHHKKWCPVCLEQWKEEGSELYEPLLWGLKDVNICLIHKIALVQNCSHCNQQINLIHTKANIGFCPHCDTWLGKKLSSDIELCAEETSYDFYCAYSIANLFVTTYQRLELPKKENISQSIKAIITKEYYGSIAKFSDFIHISGSSVSEWCNNLHHPSLAQQLLISYNFGIPFINFTDGNIDWAVIKDRNINENKVEKLTRKPLKKIDIEARKNRLVEMLTSDDLAPSLAKLCQELETTRKWLYANFPDLYEKIKEKRKHQIQEKRLLKIQAQRKEIKDLVDALFDKGHVPTTKKISQMASCPWILVKHGNRNYYYKLLESINKQDFPPEM